MNNDHSSFELQLIPAKNQVSFLLISDKLCRSFNIFYYKGASRFESIPYISFEHSWNQHNNPTIPY